MSLSNPHSKAEWRRHLRQAANAMSAQFRQQASAQISAMAADLINEFDSSSENIFAIYSALPEEPNLEILTRSQIDESDFSKLNSGISKLISGRWAYPRIVGDRMDFCVSQTLTEGPFGILHPNDQSLDAVALTDLKIIFVPALGFDLSGNRLGRGKGFYDKALQHCQALKVGVCFSTNFVDQLPHEEHDVRMDVVITEKRILRWK